MADRVPLSFVSKDKFVIFECLSTSLTCNDVMNQNTVFVASHCSYLKKLLLANLFVLEMKITDMQIGAEH